MGSVIPLLLVVVVFVLLIIVPYRRQAQRQRDVRAMQSALQPGTDVMTTSGLFGTIVAVTDRFAELEIAEGVVIRVARAAIGEVVKPEAPVLEGEYAADGAEDEDADAEEYEEDEDGEYEQDDEDAEYEDTEDENAEGEDADEPAEEAEEDEDGTEPRKDGSSS
ncbi:MAG TPA: preprotein translocase subunit YajC [Mycobacteriales bacterium]|nr:preprotein translocase subunit YajC [Mycobacteriales bacterium]